MSWRAQRERRLDERAALAEQHARRRAFAKREHSQAASWRLGRLRRPGERSPHQVSTAHFQAAYPAIAEPGLRVPGRIHAAEPDIRCLSRYRAPAPVARPAKPCAGRGPTATQGFPSLAR